MNTYRQGALTVIETVRPHNEIQRALKQIDRRLFVEKQVTLEDQAVWCVVCEVGGDDPPATVLEWRDSDGNPIHELSDGIIDRIAKMERQGPNLAARVVKANADRIERKRRDTQDHWRDIGTDFERLMSPGHSAVLPRGQHLKRSRDKLRSQGWKI